MPLAKASMPWETGSTQGKYQYHPGGDLNAAPKDAPSAVNVVVVPDVELPKVRASIRAGLVGGMALTRFSSDSMRSTTSGARRATRRLSLFKEGKTLCCEETKLPLGGKASVVNRPGRRAGGLPAQGGPNRACMILGVWASLL